MVGIYQEVAQILLDRRKCAVLTGAGISAESGIPTFRDKGGVWERYDPAVYASIEGFWKDPSKYWELRGEFIRNYDKCQPNNAHRALAELEEMGIVQWVVTQNIDGLHQKAGSRKVIELHGSLREAFCLTCGKEFKAPNVPDGVPPHCECGGVIKPNTVLFGEQLPQDALQGAVAAAESCRVMLMIGTSAVIQPAASLPYLARERHAQLVEINIEQAFPDAKCFVQEKAGVALPAIVDAVREKAS